jgi:ankyrin repeat protein
MKSKLFCLSVASLFAFATVNATETNTPRTANQVAFTAAERAEIDRFVAKFGDDVKAVEAEGFYAGATLLHTAAADCNVAVVKYLVSKGADVNAPDNWGWTPLHRAARDNSNVEVLKYLVSQGADANVKNKGGATPLAMAMTMGKHPRTIAYLESIGNNRQTSQPTSNPRPAVGDDQQAPNQVQLAPRNTTQPTSEHRPAVRPRARLLGR